MFKSGELHKRAESAREHLAECCLCPRGCGVNRLEGELGFCATGEYARIASYGAHFGEEQPLVGEKGSGTIFFASCNLRCCFCQNYDISHYPEDSHEVDRKTLASVMLTLQSQGCHNINFVTPSHVVPQIMAAITYAHEKGLTVPLVYNCSGYESVETLQLLDGVIDIYMPDFKFWNPASSRKYADASDYPEIARIALTVMHGQVGDLTFDSSGIAARGMLVRHLVMPDALDETEKILEFISTALSPETYVNIMDQFRPCGSNDKHPELRRSLTSKEFQWALELADKAGLCRVDKRNLSRILKNLRLE